MLLQLVLRQHQLWRCHQPRELRATISGQTCSLCPGPHTCPLHQEYQVCTVLDTASAARGAQVRPALGWADTHSCSLAPALAAEPAMGSQQQEQPPGQLGWGKGRVPSIKLRAFYHLPVTPLTSRHVIKNVSLLGDLMSSA